MDITTPPSWGQEICIAGNAIPDIQIDWITLVRTTVQGKTCYTLQLSNIPGIDRFKDLSLQAGWKYFLSALLEEKISAELSKITTGGGSNSQIELSHLWKKYFPDGYDEKKLQWYLQELRNRYGDNIKKLEAEIRNSKTIIETLYHDLLREYESRSENVVSWSKSKFWQNVALLFIQKLNSGTNSFADLEAINTKTLVDEVIRLEQDPRYRRWVAQWALTGTFDLLKKVGIESGIMSVGGKNRADGVFVFKSTAWQNQVPPYIILGQGNSIVASSLQEWLDQYAIDTLRPIFTQYLVNTDGEIEWEVRTHLTNWTEKILFPSNALLRDWIYHPDLLPKNAEILLYSKNGGTGITLTKMTPKWWFLSMGVNQEAYKGIEAKSEHFTLWYIDTSGNLRGNIALTGSQVHFTNSESERNTTNTGVSMVGNWEWSLMQYGNLKIGTRGHMNLSVQIGDRRTIDYAQTARLSVDTNHFMKYQFSPKLQGEIWFWYDRLWSPNLFPNTFYKLSTKERHLNHFQKWMNVDASLEYRIPGWSINAMMWKKSGLIMDTTLTRVGYAIAQYRVELMQERWKSKHPLLEDQSSQAITLRHQSHDVGIQGGVNISNIWGVRNKEVQIGASIQF